MFQLFQNVFDHHNLVLNLILRLLRLHSLSSQLKKSLISFPLDDNDMSAIKEDRFTQVLFNFSFLVVNGIFKFFLIYMGS